MLVTDNVVPYCRVTARDGAKLDGSFTVPVSRTPTLGVVQEQSQYLPDTQEEDKAALRQLGIADRKVFETLKQIRNIVGSSGNLRKEFESMDTDGDQVCTAKPHKSFPEAFVRSCWTVQQGWLSGGEECRTFQSMCGVLGQPLGQPNDQNIEAWSHQPSPPYS